jgi:outer membrane biosynthesis protein TonB
MPTADEMPAEDAGGADILVSGLDIGSKDINMNNGDDHQPVLPQPAPAPEPEPELEPEERVEAPKKNLCGICKDTVSKYKCSRCELP